MGKVQGDNPSWTEARVEEEVSRFMMDVEGTNMYIKYLKDKKMNPRDYAAEAEAELSLSNPRTVRIDCSCTLLETGRAKRGSFDSFQTPLSCLIYFSLSCCVRSQLMLPG